MTYLVTLSTASANAIAFPQRCVGCGAPPETTSVLGLNRLVARGQTQHTVSTRLEVPHCARCARLTKLTFMAGCVPFLGGGALIGLAAFAGAFWLSIQLGLDEFDDGETWPSLVVGGAAGLVAGLAGGFVFELIARIVLLPFLGQALWRTPLLAAQLLRDSDRIAGLTGQFSPDAAQVLLRFDLDDIGREVEALNRAA
jgi:hypothetical protein